MFLHCSTLGCRAGTAWVDDIIPGMLLMYSFLLEAGGGRTVRLLKKHFIRLWRTHNQSVSAAFFFSFYILHTQASLFLCFSIATFGLSGTKDYVFLFQSSEQMKDSAVICMFGSEILRKQSCETTADVLVFLPRLRGD